MALVAPKIKKDLESALLAAFAREFPKEASADPSSYKKMAAAISDAALIIVKALQTEAEIIPGIPTAGGSSAQATVAPGKIL